MNGPGDTSAIVEAINEARVARKAAEQKFRDIAQIIYDERIADGADRNDDELADEMIRAMDCAAKIMALPGWGL